MEEPFEYVKNLVVNFKLNYCCYVAPVRIGLLITAYFNIIFDLASIVGIGDDSYKPTIMQVEEIILPDNATKPIPILCYAGEFAFNVVLLAAVYRRDSILLRVYMYCCFATLITSIMFYSVVIVAMGLLIKMAMILSILFQCYVIILTRSAIVEIRLERKRLELPTLVMSSLVRETKEKSPDTESIKTKDKTPDIEFPRIKDKSPDIEVPHEAEKIDATECTDLDDKQKKDVKLETVQEHPKEEV
ncbi:uncharacterized protein LOC115450795 [Manduca sexta]|uniref:uncharacterized protein LOC115450795 n=1 Tax=Manduca sexta TaxID=7130 RepID=UPI00188F8F52|nr:uncharacterized protein LOC115450795 [Manduca sexta]